jgi:hypothetical protein
MRFRIITGIANPMDLDLIIMVFMGTNKKDVKSALRSTNAGPATTSIRRLTKRVAINFAASSWSYPLQTRTYFFCLWYLIPLFGGVPASIDVNCVGW